MSAVRLTVALSLLLPVIGCTGTSTDVRDGPELSTTDRHSGDLEGGFGAHVPARFTQLPTFQAPASEIVRDAELSDAFATLRQTFRALNIEVFDPAAAYATSPAGDFAWYFTVNDADDAYGRTQHVMFVATTPWTDQHTLDFVLSYVVLAAAPENQTGRNWFHFYSAYPVPAGVVYLFSNTNLAAFEAMVMTEVGTQTWSPESMPALAAALRAMMIDLGIADSDQLDGDCPLVLDELAAQLPIPEVAEGNSLGDGYIAEGSLAAIGLLIGESLRNAAPQELRWEHDPTVPAYPRLHLTLDEEEAVIKPIPMTIELHRDGGEVTPSTYCRTMMDRISP